MDIKSMAKSKRSHTQHHQPKKPHNPKTPSSSSTTPSTKKDVKEKKSKNTQPLPPSLPSNWDRYESEEDDENEVRDIPIYSNSDKPKSKGVDVDVVKPKSKGADFRDLIAQANDSRSWFSPSFDDKLPESYQGVAPMLAARGKKIILQDRDDDFLMEDEASGAPEAQFLTLDLEDLAERLSKVEVAKRLFIEPDLLPPELHGQHANDADNQASFQTPEKRKVGRVDSFRELLSIYLEEEQMAKAQDEVDKGDMIFSSNISSCQEYKTDDFGFFYASKTVQDNNAGKKDINEKSDDAGQVVKATNQVTESKLEDFEFLKKTEMTQTNATEFIKKTEMTQTNAMDLDTALSSRFADAAVAELDVLLGSFSDTKLFDTSVSGPGTLETLGIPLQNSQAQTPPAFAVTTSLDDELDDLLAATANPNVKDGPSFSQPPHILSSSSSQPTSKSKVLEDFDSWLDTI